MENTKKYSSKELDEEFRAWARFLYKQYRKDKLKAKFLKEKGTK